MEENKHTKTPTKIKVLVAALALCCTALVAVFIIERLPRMVATPTPAALTLWNDGESLHALTEYMTVVTDPQSVDFIPVRDRIAVFDLDGTLIGEQYPIYFEWMLYCSRVLDDAAYTPTPEQIEIAGEVLDAAAARSIPEGVEQREHQGLGEVFAGMTNADFRAYVHDFLQTEADGFTGLTLADAYFRPMVELVDYLKACDFTVYIVSGTDRDCDRVMIAEVLDLPDRQIIGSDYYAKASGQGDKAYLDYQLTPEDKIVRGAQSIIKNVKVSKAVQMAQELGQQPVLAFGNSSGDKSMFMYTTTRNPYRAAAFCLVPDDDEREYAFPQKAENLTVMCAENGWYSVSMKNDFKTLYADGVQKQADNTAWVDKMSARRAAYELPLQKVS